MIYIHYIKKLLDGLEGPFSAFIEGDPSPDWLIYDMFVHWAPRVAGKFGIPAIFFCPCTATTLSFVGPPSVRLGSELLPMTPEQLTRVPPWIPFPTKVACRHHDAVHIVAAADGGVPLFLSELFRRPIFPIGLLFPSVLGFNGGGLIQKQTRHG
ncbi:hypothetical protein ACLOJK_001375 [Asimina triloba]